MVQLKYIGNIQRNVHVIDNLTVLGWKYGG